MKQKKVIIITGASSGIGKETALKLVKEGHIVYGAARRITNMNELEVAGGHSIEMDITNENQIQSAVEKVLKEQGTIDVLINNAGYAIYGAIEDTRMSDVRRQFEVNVFGPGLLTKLVLPHMRSRKQGTIINITSMGGKMYTPLGAWYHATKHALEGWSDCLRLEVKQFGIDVVIVEPGIISTEFGRVMGGPMMERSGKGAYAKMAHAVDNATKTSYQNGGSSPASVIAQLISKVIKSENPKTRYAAGKWAKPMIWTRKYLGDRTFDKIVMSQVK